MLRKIGRLFVIKNRWEAWLVIYAIALGAVERGLHYLAQYPGSFGLALALACTGVVFVAGAKLLDSVRPAEPAVALAAVRPPARRQPSIRRSRPRRQPARRASAPPTLRRRD